MTDVLLVCVREDVERANALAEMIEAVGFTTDNFSDEALDGAAVVLAIWSPAAGASERFREATLRAARAGKALIASFFVLPPPFAKGAPVISLRNWRGDSADATLDPLFLEIDQRIRAARNVESAQAPAQSHDEDLPAYFAWARVAKDIHGVRNSAAAILVALGIVVSAAGAGAASASSKLAPIDVHSLPLSMVAADASALPNFVYALEPEDLIAQQNAALPRRGREPASAPAFAGPRN